MVAAAGGGGGGAKGGHTAPTVPGFQGPLLQTTGGLSGKATVALQQRQQQREAGLAGAVLGAGGAAQERTAAEAPAVEPSGLPAGMECSVTGRVGEQQLVFHPHA
jgi:hypothetical protein